MKNPNRSNDIVVCCCKDEEDIIDEFIEFYLAMGFDAVYIIDNGSQDTTVKKISSYVNKYPVHLLVDNRLGYEQYLQEYYHWATKESQLRWIFFIDCDEFIYFPKGSKQYFAQLDSNINCLRLSQKEVYPCLEHRCEFGFPLNSSRVAPNFDDTYKEVCIYNSNANIFAGKHRIDIPDKRSLNPSDIFIRHYAFRSRDQAQKKEENRLLSHAQYTKDVLNKILAFELDVFYRWNAYKKNFYKDQGWEIYFDGKIDYEHDFTLFLWLKSYLQDRIYAP